MSGWVLASSVVLNVALSVAAAIRSLRRRPAPAHARVRPARDWPERGGYTPARTVDLDHLPQPKDTGPAPGGGFARSERGGYPAGRYTLETLPPPPPGPAPGANWTDP